jgi:hypothetical protein
MLAHPDVLDQPTLTHLRDGDPLVLHPSTRLAAPHELVETKDVSVLL